MKKFNYAKKDTYTNEELAEILEQHATFVGKGFEETHIARETFDKVNNDLQGYLIKDKESLLGEKFNNVKLAKGLLKGVPFEEWDKAIEEIEKEYPDLVQTEYIPSNSVNAPNGAPKTLSVEDLAKDLGNYINPQTVE